MRDRLTKIHGLLIEQAGESTDGHASRLAAMAEGVELALRHLMSEAL